MDTRDWIFLVAAVGILAGFYYWHRRKLFRAGRSWKKLANRFGGKLSHQGEGWIKEPQYEMTCRIQDLPVTLDYYVTSSGRSSTYYTRIRVPVEDSFQLDIYQESIFQKIGKVFGMSDVQTGDEDYDPAFLIRSNDEDRFKRLCTREFRKRHLSMKNVRIFSEDGAMHFVRRGLLGGVDETLDMLEFAVFTHGVFHPRA